MDHAWPNPRNILRSCGAGLAVALLEVAGSAELARQKRTVCTCMYLGRYVPTTYLGTNPCRYIFFSQALEGKSGNGPRRKICSLISHAVVHSAGSSQEDLLDTFS